MVAFYNALGANLAAKKVSVGSESYRGQLQDVEIAIFGIPKGDRSATPNLAICLEVRDLEATLEKIRALPEAEILMDIELLPHGKTAVLKDPDGNSVELLELWPDSAG